MNREILLRARIKGKWVYGDLLEYPAGEFQIWTKIRENGGHNYVVDEPETIGQFTGLFDLNGKRIFDGDVIAVDAMIDGAIVKNHKKMLVRWDYGFLYMLENTFKSNGEKIQVEILGNIHDTPELLEAKQ